MYSFANYLPEDDLQGTKHVGGVSQKQIFLVMRSVGWIKYYMRMTVNTGLNRRAVQGVGLRPVACWDCKFKSRRGHGYLSCVCCVLSGRCLRQADHSSRRALPSVCVSECNLETSTMRKPWPTMALLFTCNLRDPATPCSALWPNLLHSIKVRVTSKLFLDGKRV
jgi:hypothetical protein